MATVLTPLYESTKRNKFLWTPECEKAFQKIKNKLASATDLKHYDPQLPLILTCDAFDTGLGAVLSNRDNKGVVKSIAFASKKLSEVNKGMQLLIRRHWQSYLELHNFTTSFMVDF